MTTHSGYLSADQISHTCFGTSLESAHLLDLLLWDRVGAQGTNPTGNGHGPTALQVVCLALQYSMRHYPMQPLSCTDMNRDVGRKKKNGKKAGGNIRGKQRGKAGPSLGHGRRVPSTSTGCPVPNLSPAVWVPEKRFPGGRSCSCNAPHGA